MPKAIKNTLGFFLLLGAGLAIGYFLGTYFKGGSVPDDTLKIPIFLVFVNLIIAVFGVLGLHELGHIIGGKIMGDEFALFVVGPFKWLKESDKIRFEWNTSFGSVRSKILLISCVRLGFENMVIHYLQ